MICRRMKKKQKTTFQLAKKKMHLWTVDYCIEAIFIFVVQIY